MSFATLENGFIISGKLTDNGLAGKLSEDGQYVDIYNDTCDKLLASMPAFGGMRMLADFVDMYENGVEAGKRKKTREIRDVLDL
jgi:hypothetical protein